MYPLKEIKSIARVALDKHGQFDKFHSNPKALYGYARDKSAKFLTLMVLSLGAMERQQRQGWIGGGGGGGGAVGGQ